MSACLLGERCRYDGASKPLAPVRALARERACIAVCPEQLGGLPTPRTPGELQPDGRVLSADGDDRTEAFALGARRAVDVALAHGCTCAVLKAKSPSCGAHEVYDGSFTGVLVPGEGVAAAALRRAGLAVVDETEIGRRPSR